MTMQYTFPELKEKVEKKIQELREYSFQTWGVSPEMTIRYDLNSVETLGLANYTKGEMRLNRHILMEYGEVYIDEIVVHEYAHFVVKSRTKMGHYWERIPKSHGKEFKEICSHFGIEGKATTKAFNDSKFLKEKRKKLDSNKKIHYYTCNCKDRVGYIEVSTIRHNKIQKGKASYSCRKCGSTIKYIQSGRKLIA